MHRERSKIKEMSMFEAKQQLKKQFAEEREASENKLKAAIES